MLIKVITERPDFSLQIETDSKKKILFDTGNQNVEKRYEELFEKKLEFEYIVLSHGHWDHGNGLEYLKDKKLICHPNSFIKRYRAKDRSYIGLKLNKEELKEKFELTMKDKAYKISNGVYFLGEINKSNNFEGKISTFEKENGEMDLVKDDSGMCFNTEKGLVVISGCSHSGICNIIEHAKRVSGQAKVYAVIGGFHLKIVDEILEKTINYLEKEQIDYIYTGHCTSDKVIDYLINKLNNVSKLYEGQNIELNK
ncbi:MBL fold metallo-hydrolase [Helicovermis profundi]|uniref:MBL fold metallo-hydrolase n=1 Tax=Helicovermis profundi TaxID=3065157 RepID=A0AAU9ECG9_9FIRM|nr:MBL fold metallo-hydrolase [Clostridia bacterium S502]